MIRSLSAYLNLLRLLAAMAVYLSHGQNFTKYRIPYVGNSGSEAVFVFFVLSGLLITRSGTGQPDGAAFMRARLVRLWSVCLPALALTFVADTIGQHIAMVAYAPMQPYTAIKWLGSIGINALFLNQVWNFNIFPGTNGPFWSLSYEFWYYVMFAAAFYFTGTKRVVALSCAALVAGPSILVGLPIWLMGSALHFAIARNGGSIKAGWICWFGSFAAAAAFGFFDVATMLANALPAMAAAAKWKVDFWPESYMIGLLVALNIYGFALISNGFEALLHAGRRVIQAGADISFGLYLFHYPLMYLVKAVLFGAGLTSGAIFTALVYMIPFVMAVPLALQCEKHKHLVEKIIDFVVDLFQSLSRKTLRRRRAMPTIDSIYDGSANMAGDERG